MFEIGNSLREARLRQGLDIDEAEAATKIRAKYLRGLEDERFELLPAETYVKGFLRSYADYLGLDGQLYVDEFNSRYVTGEEPEASKARRPVRTSPAQRRFESSAVFVALAGIVAATALVVVAWRWGERDENEIPNLVEPQATATSPAAAPPPAKPNAAPQGQRWITVVLTATRGNSLLTVHRRSATGPVLFTGTLEQGESMRFAGPRLWLDVGAPRNVTATIDGKAAPIPAPSGDHTVLVATRDGVRRAPTG